MTRLEMIIERIICSIDLISYYDDCLIVDSKYIDRDKNEISDIYFKTISEYNNEFDQILHKGFSWVNVSFCGIYKKKLLFCIETPKESTGVPYEYVAINTSGPFLDEKHLPIWDVSKIYNIIENT